MHTLRQFNRCLFVFVSLLIYFFSWSFVQAQSPANTVEVQDIPESEAVIISDPINVPDPTKETIYNGSGNPGATIIMTIMNENEVLFKQATTVNSTGQWRMTVPPLNQPPTEILLSSQSEITPLQEIETVTVSTAVATSGLVVLQLIIERIIRVLQIAGLLGRKKTQGFVFDVQTKKPVPFAILTIETDAIKNKGMTPLKETVVSTVDGFFKTIALPPGAYRVAVDHPNFSFPIKGTKPWYASPMDFYQGESIALGSQKELQILFIPMQSKENAPRLLSYWFNVRVFSTVAQQLAQFLSWPMAILSVAILILYPSFVNFTISSLYLVLGVQAVLKSWQTRKLAGNIKDTNGKGIPNVVVRVYKSESSSDDLTAVSLTDKAGRFSFHVLPGKYRTLISKDGLVQAQSPGLSYESLDVTKSVSNLEYSMTPIPAFDWNKKEAPPITLG